MKQLTVIFLLLLISLFSFSQTHFPIGIYAEGGYFFPKTTCFDQTLDNDFATGGGVFIGSNITSRFAVSLQAGYRYKSNKSTSAVVSSESAGSYASNDGDYGSGYGYQTITSAYKQHYFVLPFKVSYLLSKKFFFETGIETTWLLNYNRVSEKPEFNWLFGAGFNFNKLKASLNYVQGFKEQGMGETENEIEHAQIYRNRTLMLTVSYPFFSIGKRKPE